MGIVNCNWLLTDLLVIKRCHWLPGGDSSIHLLWPSIYWPFSVSVLYTLKFWLVLVNIRIYIYAIYLLLKHDRLQIPKVKCPISSKQSSLHLALYLSKNWHLETDSFQNFLLQIIPKSLFWFHTGSLLCFQPVLPISTLAIFVCKITLLKPGTNNACVPRNWEKYKKKRIQQVKLVRNSREWRRAAWIPSWQLLLVINTARKFAMWRKGWILSVGTQESPSIRQTEMLFKVWIYSSNFG